MQSTFRFYASRGGGSITACVEPCCPSRRRRCFSLLSRGRAFCGDKLAECLIGGMLCRLRYRHHALDGRHVGRHGRHRHDAPQARLGHTLLHRPCESDLESGALCHLRSRVQPVDGDLFDPLLSFISTTAMDKLHMQNINVCRGHGRHEGPQSEHEHEILVDLHHRGITRYEGVGEYTASRCVFYILVTKYEESAACAPSSANTTPTRSSSPKTARWSMEIISERSEINNRTPRGSPCRGPIYLSGKCPGRDKG